MSTMNKTLLVAAVAAVVSAATGHKAAAAAAGEVSKSAIAKLRNLATVTAEGDFPVEQAKAFLVASLKAAGMKAGSAKPYATAFTGYRVALAEGVAIETGHGDEGNKPLTAPNAREFNYSLAERAERAEMSAAKKELSKRITACKSITLLREITELLPEVVKGDKAGDVTTIDPLALLEGFVTDDEADEADADAPAEAQAA